MRQSVAILIVGLALPFMSAAITPVEAATSEQAAPMGAQTVRLFEAVRAGSLSEVQQAVLGGASLIAKGTEGKTPAELAESLEHYAITHFLRVYETIEGPGGTETAQTPPEEEDVSSPEPDTSPTLPEVTLPVIEPSPEDTAQPVLTEVPTLSEPAPLPDPAPSSQMATVTDPDPENSYFARLSVLNPSLGPSPEMVAEEAPVPVDELEEPAPSVWMEKEVELAEVVTPTPEASIIEPVDPALETEVPGVEKAQGRFEPPVATKKPEIHDSGEESSIFALVEPSPPTPESEMVAEVPSEEEDFFASMRAITEPEEGEIAELESPQEQTVMAIRKAAEAQGTVGAVDLPEHELIRAAVLKKLRDESQTRMDILAQAREASDQETQLEEQIKQHATGTANVQQDHRLRDYVMSIGSSLPPGYVPPPDGGTSALRFLQRIGVVPIHDEPQIAMADAQPTAPVAQPGGPTVTGDKSVEFAQSGYTVPPAGGTIDTNDDRSVAVLGQMAKLFASPGGSSPSLLGTTAPALSGIQYGGQQSSSSGVILPAPAPATGVATSTIALPQNPPAPAAADIPPAPGDTVIARQTDGLTLPNDLQNGWDAVASSEQNAQNTSPEINDGMVNRLANIFNPENQDAVGSGGAIRDAEGNPPMISESVGTWDVVSVQAAPSAARVVLAPATALPSLPVPSNAVLTAGKLVLGQRAVLGKGLPMGNDLVAQKKACVQKRRGAISFCIERVEWPEGIQDMMRVDTVMYQGLKAIVRYDNGVATRYHSLFPSSSYANVVNHFIARMGQPSEVWQRTITPLAKPAHPNPTVAWQAYNAATQIYSVLEVRQFDDTRGGFPDEQRGAIMMYNVKAGAIFPQVSAFELMRLRPG